MKKIFSWIDKIINYLILNKWFYIVFSILFIGIFIYIFQWGQIIKWRDPNYIIDNSLFGTYGDFIGGVLGTIFSLISILLVIKTFKYQQQVTKDNQTLSQTEQFNNLFFELLSLYQAEVNELCGQTEKLDNIHKTEDGKVKATRYDIKYNNKDFFDEEKHMIQRNYRNLKSYEQNRKRSITYYMLFYTNNRSKIAAYFRTIYRIYELIDHSTLITSNQKNEYAKIMRAQLTESELFFLRYNGMTLYGSESVKYINKYDILKHLPAFELLEFKDWWENMNNIEKESINILYYLINEALEETFANANADSAYSIDILPLKDHKTSKYEIVLELTKLCDFTIRITINKNSDIFTNEYIGLNKLNDKRIQQLFDCIIKELFIYSNFSQYNNPDEIETYSSPIYTNKNKTVINSSIRNTKSKPLIIKYKEEI